MGKDKLQKLINDIYNDVKKIILKNFPEEFSISIYLNEFNTVFDYNVNIVEEYENAKKLLKHSPFITKFDNETKTINVLFIDFKNEFFDIITSIPLIFENKIGFLKVDDLVENIIDNIDTEKDLSSIPIVDEYGNYWNNEFSEFINFVYMNTGDERFSFIKKPFAEVINDFIFEKEGVDPKTLSEESYSKLYTAYSYVFLEDLNKNILNDNNLDELYSLIMKKNIISDYNTDELHDLIYDSLSNEYDEESINLGSFSLIYENENKIIKAEMIYIPNGKEIEGTVENAKSKGFEKYIDLVYNFFIC